MGEEWRGMEWDGRGGEGGGRWRGWRDGGERDGVGGLREIGMQKWMGGEGIGEWGKGERERGRGVDGEGEKRGRGRREVEGRRMERGKAGRKVCLSLFYYHVCNGTVKRFCCVSAERHDMITIEPFTLYRCTIRGIA